MNFKKLKICASLISVLLLSSGCATLGKTTIYNGDDGQKIECLVLENNASMGTVVFENGLGGTMNSWVKVIPEISKSATVFAYNRPGYGGSDYPYTPRDGEHITAELKKLLAAKGLKAPYILVGHSLGGLYMQYFARRYPNEVKALILVDSTHPKQFEGIGSPDKWPWWLRTGFAIALNNAQEEEFNLIGKTGESVLALPPPTQTKVIVLSASKPLDEKSELADHANKLRKEITSLYPDSKQIWVDSGHNIPLEKPEVVISAIKEVIVQKP